MPCTKPALGETTTHRGMPRFFLRCAGCMNIAAHMTCESGQQQEQ
jgi:hypothetical protein